MAVADLEEGDFFFRCEALPASARCVCVPVIVLIVVVIVIAIGVGVVGTLRGPHHRRRRRRRRWREAERALYAVAIEVYWHRRGDGGPCDDVVHHV